MNNVGKFLQRQSVASSFKDSLWDVTIMCKLKKNLNKSDVLCVI